MCTLGFLVCLSCAPWGSCFVCHVHLGVHVLFVMCTLGFMFYLSCARVTLTDTVKSNLSGHSKRTQKLVFKTDYCLMQVKRGALSNIFDLH